MLTPTQANLVYLVYGIAILALPFVILISLIVAPAVEAARRLCGSRAHRCSRAVDQRQRHRRAQMALRPVRPARHPLSQFIDDPRWIAMLAAVLTVSGPWLPARWRRWWWTLLLAFVPIHLVVSAVVPARSLLGLAVGWFVGALVVLVVGTPALEVPLEGAVRAMARRGFAVLALRVVRPAGHGPLVLSATTDAAGFGRDRRDVRPEPAQRRDAAPTLAEAPTARQRDRAAADLHAPRRRASRR